MIYPFGCNVHGEKIVGEIKQFYIDGDSLEEARIKFLNIFKNLNSNIIEKMGTMHSPNIYVTNNGETLFLKHIPNDRPVITTEVTEKPNNLWIIYPNGTYIEIYDIGINVSSVIEHEILCTGSVIELSMRLEMDIDIMALNSISGAWLRSNMFKNTLFKPQVSTDE